MDDMNEIVGKALEAFEARQVARKDAEAKANAEREAVKAEVRKELEAEKDTWEDKKAPVVMKTAKPGDGEGSYADAFMHWAQTGDVTVARKYLDEDGGLGEKDRKALGEASGDGAYVVPEQWQAKIIELRDARSWPRLAGVNVFQAMTDTVNLPAEDTAIGKMTRAAEAGAFATDDPSFAANAVTVEAFTTSMIVSRQLLADNIVGFEPYYQRFVARMLAQTEAYYTAIGTGSSEHEGVFTGGDTDALTFNTDNGADSDGNLLADALFALYYTLGEGYRDGAVWLMSGATEKLFGTLKHTSAAPNYAAPALNQAEFRDGRMWFLGRPVFNQADISAKSSGVGFVAFGHPDYYTLIDREGLSVIRDPYTRAANGQVKFHNFMRQNGKVTVEAAWVIGVGA